MRNNIEAIIATLIQCGNDLQVVGTLGMRGKMETAQDFERLRELGRIVLHAAKMYGITSSHLELLPAPIYLKHPATWEYERRKIIKRKYRK